MGIQCGIVIKKLVIALCKYLELMMDLNPIHLLESSNMKQYSYYHHLEDLHFGSPLPTVWIFQK